MKKLILPLIVLLGLGLGLAGCDKKPTDLPKPKASLTQPKT